MPGDRAAVLDMLEAARLARSFTEDLDLEEFRDDERTQSATIHQILVLGEAAKRVPEAVRAEAPDLPWSEVAGMRDRLIHRYHDVDLDEVWRTATRDLPPLLEKLEAIAPDPDKDDR